jgi:hypothetical protein
MRARLTPSPHESPVGRLIWPNRTATVRAAAALALALLALAGCAFRAPEDRGTEASRFPRRYSGFTIQRPGDLRWKFPAEGQERNRAVLGVGPLSATHTALGSVGCFIAPEGVADLQQLEAALDARLRASTPRHQLLSHQTSASTYKGHPCVRYVQRVLDKKPVNSKTPLVMVFDGVALLHPSLSGFLVDMFFSERGTEDEVGKGTSELKADFLQIVDITAGK